LLSMRRKGCSLPASSVFFLQQQSDSSSKALCCQATCARDARQGGRATLVVHFHSLHRQTACSMVVCCQSS
jgi:hypothetical protein